MSLFSFSHFLVSFFLFKKFSGLCLFLFSAVSYSLCLDPSFLKYSCVFMLRVISFMYTKSGEMWEAHRTGFIFIYCPAATVLLLYMGGRFIFVAPFFFWDAISFFLCQKEHFLHQLAVYCVANNIYINTTLAKKRQDFHQVNFYK